MSRKDYYKILGLESSATPDEIKTSYRKLARKYHPDVSKEANAEEKFKEAKEAYEVLKDPEKRDAYDSFAPEYQDDSAGQQYGNRQQYGANENAEFSRDFFESIFGGRNGQGAAFAGQDYSTEITISLEESYNGVEKELHIPMVEPGSNIPKTQTLKVKIPTNVRTGQKIRLAHQGGFGSSNAPRGDLYIKINVAKHLVFNVIGDDIYTTLAIAPWEAALGVTLSIPTLSGAVEMKIPPNSQGGQKFRLKGRGLRGKFDGDQYVVLKIVIPKAETERAKELYKKMAAEMPFNPRTSV